MIILFPGFPFSKGVSRSFHYLYSEVQTLSKMTKTVFPHSCFCSSICNKFKSLLSHMNFNCTFKMLVLTGLIDDTCKNCFCQPKNTNFFPTPPIPSIRNTQILASLLYVSLNINSSIASYLSVCHKHNPHPLKKLRLSIF